MVLLSRRCDSHTTDSISDCLVSHDQSKLVNRQTTSRKLLLLLRSYDHALDPESGSLDEVGGRHQVFFGAPKLVSQRCPVWPVLKSCFCVHGRGQDCLTCSGVTTTTISAAAAAAAATAAGNVNVRRKRITRAVFGV